MIKIKSAMEIECMKIAGKIVAEAHELVKRAICPGITTQELDKIAEEYIVSQGAKPSFKGYSGFPASICTSINEQVVHGIPDSTKLCEGDILSVDIGAYYKGYHGDAARTHPIGKVSELASNLIKVTRESFYEGIKFAKEGCRLYDISSAIQKYVEQHGYSVVREFVGHGIGKDLHEDPQVPNFGESGRGPRLRAGMVLAIEPMVNVGGYDVKIMPNKWTVVTKDKSLSAHYEHTVVITKDNPLLLTTI